MHSRWLLADADKEIRRLVSHRARAMPRSAPRGTTMSAGQRAADLAADCKLLVDVGSMTLALYVATQARVQDVLYGLKNCTFTSGDTRGARAQAAARTQGLPEDRAPMPAARKPPTKTTEKGGPRGRGVQERAQDAARALAKPKVAKGKQPATGTNAETAQKRAKKSVRLSNDCYTDTLYAL